MLHRHYKKLEKNIASSNNDLKFVCLFVCFFFASVLHFLIYFLFLLSVYLFRLTRSRRVVGSTPI